MSDKPEISVVVPVYQSEKTLHELYKRISFVFENDLRKSYEVILIDDASPDASWNEMLKIHQMDTRFKIIRLARNFGQHCALMCGFAYAGGDYIVTMDDDLQHPPEEIPKLVRAMESDQDVDLVIGAYVEKKHSFIRNLGTAASRKLSHYIFKTNPRLRLSSFRCIRALTAKAILDIQMERPRVGHLLLQMSNKIVNVTVHHDPRKYGRSGYTYKRLVKDLISNVMNNSSLPLQWISGLGFFSSIFSFMLAGYYFYRYFFVGIPVAGWTTLVLLLLFYFGVLLLAVGIIGEYLIRIIKESRRLPQYVIRSKEL